MLSAIRRWFLRRKAQKLARQAAEILQKREDELLLAVAAQAWRTNKPVLASRSDAEALLASSGTTLSPTSEPATDPSSSEKRP